MPRSRKKRIKTNRLKSRQNNKKSSYKQIANITKGFSKLHWGKCLFPDYRELSGPKGSRKRINRAKIIVKYILEQESDRIIKAFENFAKKKYYNQNPTTIVDLNSAVSMVENTTLYTDDECLYGYSDGYSVYVSAIKMSNEALVGTILHESLHNIGTINGKDICGKDEHTIMKSLGEQLDY